MTRGLGISIVVATVGLLAGGCLSNAEWLCSSALPDGGCGYYVVPECSGILEGHCPAPDTLIQDGGACEFRFTAACL